MSAPAEYTVKVNVAVYDDAFDADGLEDIVQDCLVGNRNTGLPDQIQLGNVSATCDEERPPSPSDDVT